MEPPAGREDSCDCETLMWMKLREGSKDPEQMQQSESGGVNIIGEQAKAQVVTLG